MNENLKKGGLIAVVVLAVGAVAFNVFNRARGERMIVDRVIEAPPGYKSEKQLAIEQAEAAKAGQPVQVAEEPDLGGDLVPGGAKQ